MFRFDPYSPEVDADPFPLYRRLRDEFPCFWSEEARMWVLSRYADVFATLNDWKTFSSAKGNMMDELPNRAGSTLGTTDPPRHDRLRALIQHAFIKRNLEALHEPIREITIAQLDTLAGAKQFDFVGDFSAGITSKVLFRLLGLPAGDDRQVRDKAVLMVQSDPINPAEGSGAPGRIRMDDAIRGRCHRRTAPAADRGPGLATGFGGDQRRAARRARGAAHHHDADHGRHRVSRRLHGYVRAQPRRLRRRTPAPGREPRPDPGRDRGVVALQHFRPALPPLPDADLELHGRNIPDAIEESLRFNTSGQRFRRCLTRDLELHGQKVRQGDFVCLAYGSANRDERQFPNPDVYDIARKPRSHLGFGGGVHSCLGAMIARVATTITFEELLKRFPRFERVRETLDWIPSSTFRSPLKLELAVN